MNKKNIVWILTLMLFLVATPLVSAVAENAPYTLTSLDAGYSAKTGYKISANDDVSINSITKHSSTTATVAYILDSSKSKRQGTRSAIR